MLDQPASTAASVLLGLVLGASAQASLATLGLVPPRIQQKAESSARGFVLLALALASLGIALFEIDPLNWPIFVGGSAIGLATMQLLHASAAQPIRVIKTTLESGGLAGAALATAIWVPTVASFLTAVAYLAAPAPSFAKDNAAAFGTAVALALWFIASYAIRPVASVASANATSFDLIVARLQRLNERIAKMRATKAGASVLTSLEEASLDEAQTEVDAVRALAGLVDEPSEDLTKVQRERLDRSPRWILGIGYIDAWRRVHHAEEALFMAPDTDLVTEATETIQRITDSGFKTELSLRYQVRVAVQVLEKAAAPYFRSLETAAVGPLETDLNAAAQEANQPPNSQSRARHVIREVRHIINDFRDSRWEGLVHARNSLAKTAILTGSVAYVLLVLAVTMGVPEGALLAAVVYYFIGAAIGLFVRLREDAKATTGVDDYGLATVNLIHTPLVSGLAAVAGVLVTALVASPAVIAVLAPPVATVAPIPAQEMPKLTDIFSLNYTAGLLISAIFGFSPSLLITRLQEQSERFKQDIEKSGPAAASAP